MQLHYNQLLENIDKINPELVASVAATLPKTPKVPGASELCAALNDAGVGDCLEADDARSSAFMLTERKRTGTINGRTTVRTHGQSAGGGSEDARDAQGAPLLTDVDEERDETLYCFCNRPSFGEMIGCDSDECKYEWVCLWLTVPHCMRRRFKAAATDMGLQRLPEKQKEAAHIVYISSAMTTARHVRWCVLREPRCPWKRVERWIHSLPGAGFRQSSCRIHIPRGTLGLGILSLIHI